MPVDYSSLPFPTAAHDVTPVTTPSTDVSHNGEHPPTNDDEVAHTQDLPDTNSPEPSTTTASSHPVLRTNRKLTDAGRSFADSIQAAKARVLERREKQRQLRDGTAVVMEEMLDDTDSERDQFACLCREGVMEDFPDTFSETDDFVAAVSDERG